MRCGDCKHWGKQYEVGSKSRTCQVILHSDDMDDDCLAFVIDAENYAAALKTKADFGCVLFERKDEEQSES